MQKSDEREKECKLLTCLGDEESVYSFDILDLLDRREEEKAAAESTALGLIGREIDVHFVGDDDEDEEQEERKEDVDGSASVRSDLTA